MSKPKRRSPPPPPANPFGVPWREFHESRLAHRYPNAEAFRWHLRKYRRKLAEAGVLTLVGNVPHLDADKFLPAFDNCIRAESMERIARLR